MPEPIRIPCEGSDCIGHGEGCRFGAKVLDPPVPVTMCVMCGQHVDAEITPGGFRALAHDRDDVLAMIARGDYG